MHLTAETRTSRRNSFPNSFGQSFGRDFKEKSPDPLFWKRWEVFGAVLGGVLGVFGGCLGVVWGYFRFSFFGIKIRENYKENKNVKNH